MDFVRAREGQVRFSEFMERALYDPEHGYYAAPTPRYGRGGDFLTAPTASPWYARVLAKMVGRLAESCGPLALVDLAAGDGSLVGHLVESVPEAALSSIVGVEASAAMRTLARKRLGDSAVVAPSLDEVPAPRGAVLVHASELYDALPVERVVKRSDGLMELAVAVQDGGLAWREVPARPHVAAYFADHGVSLVEGQVAEANLRAGPLHRRVLEWAGENACSLVLDYGYPADRLYNPRGRAQGTLVCYRRHRLGRDPLEDPGQQDLTAHVNWDDLRGPASALGWRELGLWPLAEFLVRAGLGEVAEEHGLGIEAEPSASVVEARQELKRLLDPEGMGSDLKLLVQAQGALAEAAEGLF